MPDPQVRYCTTEDAVRIAYFSAGRGPAIVFASNIWGDANMYAAPHPHTRYMTDRLVELGWRVVRYDLRGMGSSQRDVDDFSLEALVLDLQAVVDRLSLQRFAVAGVDSAAAVAMAFAAGNRDRVSHVVVLNGGAFAPERGAGVRVSNVIASMSSLAEEDWDFFTLAIAKLVTELDDPVHTQRLAETFRHSSSAKVHQAVMRVRDQIDLRPILPALEMPVLVVHDTGFPFGSFELCQDLAASLPDARFVVITADRDAEIDAIDSFLRAGSDEPEPTPPTPSQADSFRTMAAPAVQPQSFASGRYVVSKLLGEGGQKIVFLARDTQLGRDVAVALLKAEGLEVAGLARLRREAQALARLEAQPNIVAIYDISEHEGRPFTVCEFLAGGTLEQELARAGGALPAERAVAIARDVCRALVVAHGGDIIHRDIKPSNIWLTGAGSAKLGDFGLATALDRSRVTQAGTIMGTAAYMAPEQALGGEIDQRSDLYSLGCVLYEMLTGRPPFVANTAVAVVSQHINASPLPPSNLQPGLPRALERFVMQMLAKSQQDRPQTAAEVLEELQQIEKPRR
jgi:pimeloyl-ACP methyl ester carboxylesterase